ncbi:RHS repeat domain-containing protein [Desulforhopalus singaporensis]|uniref:YD repeat-containing protein n=1 Tax=Desulforhopalus singaporensis TaxID=91360 RepID=A0A1H0SWB9_9BACT|nr:RHS repeat domain-containing protein [Desulforhopalus singaporensis]SDP45981.1 YD repeat-containing protein [Desulforhopalus singaporensis]
MPNIDAKLMHFSCTSYYQYNADNLLVTVEDSEGYVTGYGYDTIGRMVYKQEEQLPHQGKGHGQGDGKHQGKHKNMAKKVKSTDYIYDGLEVLQEITGSGSQKVSTYHRAVGRIVSRQDYTTGDSGQHHINRPRGQRLYYAYDGLAIFQDMLATITAIYSIGELGVVVGIAKHSSSTFYVASFGSEMLVLCLFSVQNFCLTRCSMKSCPVQRRTGILRICYLPRISSRNTVEKKFKSLPS